MKKILILAANPRKDLNLGREIRDLRNVIESSRNVNQFDVEDALAVRVGDLQALLLKHKPHVVHFCGHGSGPQGLVFERSEGGEQWVRSEALSNLFKLCSSHVECVLLNACYSEEQATAIVKHINYVIGVKQEIQDDAAIAFSKGFYQALGYDHSIEDSFEWGRNAIHIEISGSSKTRSTIELSRKAKVVNWNQELSIPEHLKPILKKRNPLSNQGKIDSSQPSSEGHDIDIASQGSSNTPSKGSSGKASKKTAYKGKILGALLVSLVLATGYLGYRIFIRPEQVTDTVPDTKKNAFNEAIKQEKMIIDQIYKKSEEELTLDFLDETVNQLESTISLMEDVPNPSRNYSKSLEKIDEYEIQVQYTKSYMEALKNGSRAGELTHDGIDSNTFEEWENITELWQQAIDSLKSVATASWIYRAARQKINTYTSNIAYSKEKRLNASFFHAVRKANRAYQDTTATKAIDASPTSEDWINIAALWGEAARFMEQVPQEYVRYQEAQGKVEEYRQNQQYAREQAAALVDNAN